MNISWVVASRYKFPEQVSIDTVKSIGPVWASYKASPHCRCDNLVCDDLGQAQKLLTRVIQSQCNLYLPRKIFQPLGRPGSVFWYNGQFASDLDDVEDIISMHLAKSTADLILLCGFDFASISLESDAIVLHKKRHYLGLCRQVILANPDVQWVLIDHDGDIDKAFLSLTNLTRDSMQNVVKLLTN